MKFFITFLFLILSTATMSAYDESAVLEETNFHKLASQMKQNEMGLVMMLHAEYCEYCELMDEKILSPMVRSGEYKKRVYIRKLQIDKPEFVTNFKGKREAASDVAATYDSQLTPTLVFLDYKGEEKAVKIIGINSIELFSASVDKQIDVLLLNVKRSSDEENEGAAN